MSGNSYHHSRENSFKFDTGDSYSYNIAERRKEKSARMINISQDKLKSQFLASPRNTTVQMQPINS
jgi:hypothetical protein